MSQKEPKSINTSIVTQHNFGCKYTLKKLYRIMRLYINYKIGQIETGYIQSLQETGHNEPKWSQKSQN